MGNALTAAVKLADLPALLEQHYPSSRAHGLRVHPAWRSDSRDASAGLKRFADGAWSLTDFVLSKSWNAFTFLTDLCGYAPRDAARLLIAETGVIDETHSPARASPAQVVLDVDALPDFPLEVLSVMRLDRLYFGGRLVHDALTNTVTDEGRRYFLEPLAGWLEACLLVSGLGQPQSTGRGVPDRASLSSSRGCSGWVGADDAITEQPVSSYGAQS